MLAFPRPQERHRREHEGCPVLLPKEKRCLTERPVFLGRSGHTPKLLSECSSICSRALGVNSAFFSYLCEWERNGSHTGTRSVCCLLRMRLAYAFLTSERYRSFPSKSFSMCNLELLLCHARNLHCNFLKKSYWSWSYAVNSSLQRNMCTPFRKGTWNWVFTNLIGLHRHVKIDKSLWKITIIYSIFYLQREVSLAHRSVRSRLCPAVSCRWNWCLFRMIVHKVPSTFCHPKSSFLTRTRCPSTPMVARLPFRCAVSLPLILSRPRT